MLQKRVWLLTILALAAALVTIGATILPGWIAAAKTRAVTGTIIFVDMASRQATLEIKSPKDGHLVEIPGHIPADCPIRINGQAATLEQVVAGDRAVVRGVWNKTTRQIVDVEIHREPAGSPLVPATQP